jgi:glycine cleavage system H protein
MNIMKVPENLKYSKEHEWVRMEGKKAYIGITDYAQHSLGDIVFVELPEKGKKMLAGETLGAVESVKAVSDVYSPVSGYILDINEKLVDSPENINKDPYENWIVLIEMEDESELEQLVSPQLYKEYCDEQ